MSFFQVMSLKNALERTRRESLFVPKRTEEIPIVEAEGRILSGAMYSEKDVPDFFRSTLDGYAVKAESVSGASEFSPAFLKVVGSVEMGASAEQKVELEQAIYVPTGGMIPPEADAIVMIEFVEEFDDETIAVFQSVSPGTGIMQKGEDMKKGEMILPEGSVLTSSAIGVLAALGHDKATVYQPPKICYYSTGDEIVQPPNPITGGQVWDITRHTVGAMLRKHHMPLSKAGHIPDIREALESELSHGVAHYDVVILSGGSSVGTKDMVAQVVAELGEPGVLIHGLLLKPGKPAVVARVDNTLVFGLPGHPASSYIVLAELVLPILKQMMGWVEKPMPNPCGTLTKNVPASDGRRTYYTVTLEHQEDAWMVTPLFGKSGAISWLSSADGYIVVPEGTEGIVQGQQVEIHFFP